MNLVIGCFIGGFSSDYLIKKQGLKWGRRAVGMFGLAMSGICMLTATFIPNTTNLIVFLAFGLAFKDFTLPVSWATSADIGGQNVGVVAGAMGMAGQLGSTIMSIAFGCNVILGGLLWLRIDPTKKTTF